MLSKRLRAAIAAAVILAASPLAAGSAPAKLSDSAPADMYFGRMKLSYLGINNTFTDAKRQVVAYTNDAGIMNKLGFADEALTQWAKAYPRDPQLARSYFLATEVYKKIWVKSYQDKAWAYMHQIVQKFPDSYFGKQVKKELAIGFTEHYFFDPLPCPAPGEPNPTPRPQPTQSPGGPKVEVHELPCVAPPTPAPLPTAAPVAPLPVPASPAAPASPMLPTSSLPPVPSAPPIPAPSPTR